jgi:PAS domain S-box-containing protein
MSGDQPMCSPFQQYFEELPCYLTVQNRDFRIIDANKRFIRDFGEPEGRFCYQIYKRRSDRCEVCPVARTFRDGERHESEEQVKTDSGVELSTIVHTTPIRNESGEITAVMEMSTDITHIKNTEKLLRQSEEYHHLLFNEVPCYISIQDRDLNIVDVNFGFMRDFGNGLGRKCFEAYKHRGEPCAPCPVQEAFEDGEMHTREETVQSRDGTNRNVLVTAAPIRDQHGSITHVMEMSADITQVRELEDRLTQLGLLVGSVSHGLKGLLNGLAGGMYLVNSGFKKGDQARVDKGWATVQRNASRIQSMVSDILYYAKDRVPSWEPLSAIDVVEEVCAQSELRAKELNVDLSKSFDAEAGEFEADAQAIRALLANLVENSMDACRMDENASEHMVSVSVKGCPEHVEFEVEDNGIGMDQETRDKAFTLFFSSKGTGTGLGLFISDRIATAHGGSIDLDSKPGEGTRFVVRLPRNRPAESESEDSSPAEMEALNV